MARVKLAAFDFDHTLIDDNSDVVVWKAIHPELEPQVRTWSRAKRQWTEMMGAIMEELQSAGFQRDAIDRALSQCAFPDESKAILKHLKACGWTVVIISNANMHFIESILDSHGCRQYVDAIYSNPTHWDDRGVLRIQWFHSGHSCQQPCPQNMCKGMILDKVIADLQPEVILYSGDGENDFCSVLHLRHSADHAFVRSNFSLERCVRNHNGALPCSVSYWATYADFLTLFQKHVS
jgi:pyridoxal phosphate phosphatase PHOSPHO2